MESVRLNSTILQKTMAEFKVDTALRDTFASKFTNIIQLFSLNPKYNQEKALITTTQKKV